MLNAYQKSLDGDNSEFDAMSDNQYYSEFKDRKELLNTSIDAGKEKDKTGRYTMKILQLSMILLINIMKKLINLTM